MGGGIFPFNPNSSHTRSNSPLLFCFHFKIIPKDSILFLISSFPFFQFLFLNIVYNDYIFIIIILYLLRLYIYVLLICTTLILLLPLFTYIITISYLVLFLVLCFHCDIHIFDIMVYYFILHIVIIIVLSLFLIHIYIAYIFFLYTIIRFGYYHYLCILAYKTYTYVIYQQFLNVTF